MLYSVSSIFSKYVTIVFLKFGIQAYGPIFVWSMPLLRLSQAKSGLLSTPPCGYRRPPPTIHASQYNRQPVLVEANAVQAIPSLGGSLKADSSPGSGSSFAFTSFSHILFLFSLGKNFILASYRITPARSRVPNLDSNRSACSSSTWIGKLRSPWSRSQANR